MLIKRLINAFRYSLSGVVSLWRRELAFRLEVCILVFFLPLTFFLTISNLHRLFLFFLLILLLIIEAINSAIEAVIDRISTDFHEQSKQAKDMASAAVFFTVLMNIIAWGYTIYYIV